MVRNKLIKKMLSICFMVSILYVISSPAFSDDPVGTIYSIFGSPCTETVTNNPNDGSWLPNAAFCVASGICTDGVIGGVLLIADTCPNQSVTSRAQMIGAPGDWRLIGKTQSTTATGFYRRFKDQYVPCGFTAFGTVTDQYDDGGACYRAPGGEGDDGGGGGGGYEPSICDYVTGYDQFGQYCGGGGGGNNCDYCEYNWQWTAGCASPYDRDYCG